MSRAMLWSYGFVLASGVACLAAVLFVVIPAYGAIGPVPPAGTEFIWLPRIAQGQQLSRAGWLMSASSCACLSAAVAFRRPSTPAERLALAVAIAVVALNAAVWVRYGSRMIWALSWTVGHESVRHWFR